jgi:hypothetical protein
MVNDFRYFFMAKFAGQNRIMVNGAPDRCFELLEFSSGFGVMRCQFSGCCADDSTGQIVSKTFQPFPSGEGSVGRLPVGGQALKVSHDLVIHPADPVIAELYPLGPLPGLFQPQDVLPAIWLHGLQNFPIDDPHRNISRLNHYRPMLVELAEYVSMHSGMASSFSASVTFKSVRIISRRFQPKRLRHRLANLVCRRQGRIDVGVSIALGWYWLGYGQASGRR